MVNKNDIEKNFTTLRKRVVDDMLTIDDRTFQIRKFDPLLGNFIVMKLLTCVIPFGLGDIIGKKVPGFSEAVSEMGSQVMMSKAEFLDLQRDILKHAVEILPGDKAPVVREDGTYGIMNFTQKICIELLIAILAFNFSDFFVGKESKDGLDQGQDSSSASTKESTQGFTYL